MANILLYVNNARSSLLTNIGPTDTAIALPNGEGARFPAPSAGQSFILTIEDTTGALEVVEVTGRTNDVLTVIRGRDGTAARAFTAGDSTAIEARVTAGMLSYLDWRSVAGLEDGSVQLDGDAMIPAAVLTTGVKAVADPLYNVKLGWTPVQQGGGTGQAATTLKLGQVDADHTRVSLQMGADTPVQLLTRLPDATGKVVLTQSRFYATSFAAADDRIYMGSAGIYYNATDTFQGGGSTAAGSRWGYSYSTLTFNVLGTITQNSVAVSIAGHTHTTAQITDFAAFAATCMRTSGTNNTGNIEAAGYVRAQGGIYDQSDERVKTSIRPMTLQRAEAIIRGANPVTFHNKNTNRKDFGLTAQHMLPLTPEIVDTDAAGMMMVAYQRMVAPITVVLQSLLTERDLLRARVEALEAK